MQQIPESRREWLLHKFHYHAITTGRAKEYKIWRDDNHAVIIEGAIIRQKIDYIHNNPVVAMIVSEPQAYIFSNANVYTGSKQALVKVCRYDDANEKAIERHKCITDAVPDHPRCKR